MQTDEINIGIPKLSATNDGRWQRTWLLTFQRGLDFRDLSELATNLSDDSLNVSLAPAGVQDAAVELCSGEHIEYTDFWDNGFRIMLLLDRNAGLIERIEGKPRKHWRRFFFQADHEKTLDRYKTNLMVAARDGDYQKVVAEIRASGNIDEKSFSGKTSLMYAALYGHVAVVEQLLSNNASINVFGPEWTPLETASRGRSVEITQILLQAGADANAQNCYGETPLMWAVVRGATDIVDLLLRNRADVRIRDDEGKAAQDWAELLQDNVIVKDQYQGISRLLREFGADDE